MSGFLRGTWFSYGFSFTGGAVTLSRIVDGQSVDGRLAGDSVDLVIPTFFDGEMGADQMIDLRLRGVRSGSAPFTVQVTQPTLPAGTRTVGTLTATKQ